MLGLRKLMTLSCGLALECSINKDAALGALVFAVAYLALLDVAAPTQWAFVMTGLVLIAVLLSREAMSMHLFAWAAKVVVVFRSKALLTESFQSSFVVVLALVVIYGFVAALRRAQNHVGDG